MKLIKGMNDDVLFEIAVHMNNELAFNEKVVFGNCFSATDGLEQLKRQMKLDKEEALELAMIITEKGFIIHAAHQLKTYVDDASELYRFNQCRSNMIMKKKVARTEEQTREIELEKFKQDTAMRTNRGNLLKQVVTVASIRNHLQNGIANIAQHQNKQLPNLRRNFKDPHLEPAKTLLECLACERDVALFQKFAKSESSSENIDFYLLVEVCVFVNSALMFVRNGKN
jgi:hypothetical protein